MAARPYASSVNLLESGIDMAMIHDRIEVNPTPMVGKPVIRGTRIPVELILRKLSEGVTVLDGYPHLGREDILAAIAYAADAEGRTRTSRLTDD
jgi:uncharacterized protein (DUF433 family)